MSDLFKDHKPELTEEEDRLLWQRVRTIPRAPVPEPWWRRLFAMPAVRYGAPAFAVLIAAVVYVVEQAPEPKLRVEPAAPKVARERTSAPAPPPTASATRSLSTPVPTPAAQKPSSEPENEKVVVATEDALKAGLDDKDQRHDEAQNFALPPAELQKSKRSANAPAPIKEEERKQDAAVPPSAEGAAAPTSQSVSPAAPRSGSTWGMTKSTYRESGPATGLSGLLAGGGLPSHAALASHPIVVETAGPGALSGSVPLPDEPGARAVIALSPDAAPQARIEKASLGLLRDVKKDGEYERFEDAPARLQATALAVAFERALANPSGTPRASVERLLVRARVVAARGDATPGAARLVTMIEGALHAWPAPAK